jgi:hypothetical protein
MDTPSNILSLAWNCSKPPAFDYSYRLLVLDSSNGVNHVKVPVAPTHCIPETSSVTLAKGIQARNLEQTVLVSDISHVMRERVALGYGLDVCAALLCRRS